MKKTAVFSLVISFFIMCANAAPVSGTQRRAAPVVNNTTETAVENTSASARAARTAPAVRTNTAPAAAPVRSAVRQSVPVSAQTTAVRSGSVPTVSARAGTVQKVVGSGTKVATAAQNIVVNEVCRNKYNGCMDSFCMLENANGGRCICSARNAELDSVLSEIERLDAQSYKMATLGVEKLEMGADADATMATVDKIIKDGSAPTKSTRRKLDMSLWDNTEFEVDEDIFDIQKQSSLDGKVGDGLHRAASDMCVAQMPECSNDITMLKMIYSGQIKSDCAAYENDLKKQQVASQNKLSAAEKALRETALEQLRLANKWDLGQCTVEFKKCMSTTAGCKDDFTGCVGIAAAENAKSGTGKSSMKMFDIKGAVSKISVAASTIDALTSKKEICMNVTNSCVVVRDQVWDTFLREVAPQLKTAELLAESDLRTSCISNISTCFQKACRDTMDPNDPDGSYDLCLTRPETIKSLCRVQIDPCVAAEPLILDFVYARMAGMRVDSCTTAVKDCLSGENMCGSDYTQCIGLDTDTIMRMCPYDKLVGCQKVYSESSGKKSIAGNAVYEEISTMVQGIMLGIDNSMLTECQAAADAAMVKVCGGTADCNGLAVDDGTGARSLEYKICEYSNSATTDSGLMGMAINYSACRTDVSQIMDDELGRVQNTTTEGLGAVKPFAGVLDGVIYWESVEFDKNGKLTGAEEYLTKIGKKNGVDEKSLTRIKSELAVLQKNIDTAVNAIESDAKVQFCMTGRKVQGMKVGDEKRDLNGTARFPALTKQMRLIIATSALKVAKDNYYAKYDELNKKVAQDYIKIGERMAINAGENALDARREYARLACINLADASALPKSPNPPKNAFGKIASMVAIAGAAVAVPFTGGASMIAVGGLLVNGAAVAGGAVAAVGLFGNMGGGANGADGGTKLDLIGSKQVNQWNYKETITSTFTWETLNCNKCIRSQTCGKTGNPLFGSKYCKSWDTEVSKCDDTQF